VKEGKHDMTHTVHLRGTRRERRAVLSIIRDLERVADVRLERLQGVATAANSTRGVERIGRIHNHQRGF